MEVIVLLSAMIIETSKSHATDVEAVSVLDSPARLQEKVPYVPLKGIDFLLKIAELRDPRQKASIPLRW